MRSKTGICERPCHQEDIYLRNNSASIQQEYTLTYVEKWANLSRLFEAVTPHSTQRMRAPKLRPRTQELTRAHNPFASSPHSPKTLTSPEPTLASSPYALRPPTRSEPAYPKVPTKKALDSLTGVIEVFNMVFNPFFVRFSMPLSHFP